MSNKNKPAFPNFGIQKDANSNEFIGGCFEQEGFTKREYAAMKAMQGILAADKEFEITAERIAIISVQHADLLLAELAKEADND